MSGFLRLLDGFRAHALIIVLSCAAVALAYGMGRAHERSAQSIARETMNRRIRELEAQASGASAAERVADALSTATQEKELTDAVADAPNSAPDAARVAYGCQRLRQTGRTEASLPTACRR